MKLLDGTELFSWCGAWMVVGALLFFNIAKTLWEAFYNLYLHPLRKFPGPKLWIAFPILRSFAMIGGKLDYTMKDLHDQYGDVVRFNPDGLSFISAQAWKDIYGFGHTELPKHFPHFGGFNGQNILSAKGSDHFRFRRAMLPAFTDKSLAMQEPLIDVYVDLLMKRLREVAESGKPTNIIRWYNYTTFDLIGDLAYGESFKGLEEGKSNLWIDTISNMLKLMPILALMSISPMLGRILQLFAGSKIRNSKKAHLDNATALAMKRINRTDQKDRGDFMDAMMRAKGQKHELTDAELVHNADILITAGSETTTKVGVHQFATYHSTTNFHLPGEFHPERWLPSETENPASPFYNDNRECHKPFSFGPRDCIGRNLALTYTKVGVHQFATYHSTTNFHLPGEFHPERWLPSETENPASPFYNDNRECHKPFSFGPRDCIGRNLAYHEMRIILARMLWGFDLQFAEDGVGGMDIGGWERQKIFGIWVKPPLMVKVTRRKE
ncbi:related to cytochrome P450 CYP3/CYP5/CYP6/CYP9 subfamilies [Phialocephala subalpina]|uniref:Related to cytochrome P450 CYP3/CYP5/CYP6/CYP9 subfamilies n=1 Tax=Phialocephala subalpina TaxID=576137 RepID=A0A1L7XG47_9HELO|nr:related to cytochrome P450 CYP3/CYP5/CYP6/CYP9 subfamilies [Phialocephala subalpina]